MAAITKDTECYAKLPGETRIYETTDFPQTKHFVQSFYGDDDGAATPRTDMIYHIGDLFGTAMGEVVVDHGEEYQLISGDVTVRDVGSPIFMFRGAGTYRTEKRPLYVKSSDISIDKQLAGEQKYQRENKDKIAKELEVKKKQDLIDSLSNNNSSPQTGNQAGTGTGLNITSIIVIVFSFLGLIIGGVLWWKGKQNKKAQSIQNTNTPLNNTSNGSI